MNKTSILPCPASIIIGFIVFSALFFACKKANPGNINPPTSINTGGGVLVSDTAKFIGVNYNESLQEINFGELARSKTKWVRGFLDVFYHYDYNNLTTSPRIVEYQKLKGQGYKTIVNLKFNFKTRSYPSVNSSQWTGYITYIDRVLDAIINYTDAIVVGNEPFIESENSAYDEPLNAFYKAATERVNDYLKHRNISRRIFIGAIDNLYQFNRQNEVGVNKFLAYCKATPWIAGVDLHIHHSGNKEITSALDFVNDKIRDDQKIIITEYSLMKWWRSNLTLDISSEFVNAAKANTTDQIFPPPPGITKCWQYIDYALKNPRQVQEWNAFNQNTAWLEDRKDYMCNSFQLFKDNTKFWIATYAMRQSYPPGADFTSTTDPWVLNSLFTGRSVELLPNGEAQGRYSYFNQFSAINTGILVCD
jgi:hypothetical protein